MGIVAILGTVFVKEIVPILIRQVALPEIMRAIKKKQQEKNGDWPTEDEVFEELKQNAFKVVEEGEAFLARTKDPR